MTKMNKILIAIIIILVIALAIMTRLYFIARDSSKRGLDATLEAAELNYNLNLRINELEKQLGIYEE